MFDADFAVAARDAYPERRRDAGLGRLEPLGRTVWTYVGRTLAARAPAAFATTLAGPARDGDLALAAAALRRRLGHRQHAEDARLRLLAMGARAAVLGGLGEPSTDTLRAAWTMLAGAVADLPPGADACTATILAGGTAAGRGLPVHLLAEDDQGAAALADRAAAILPRLGLTVAGIGARTGEPERRDAYAADVVCAPLQVLAFDYLRDRVRMGRRLGALRHRMAAADGGSPLRGLLMRGLGHGFAVNADGIMVDRAHTPLVLRDDPQAEQPAMLARLSLPDFLGRYLGLGGCAPAAAFSARDFRRLYGMPVVGGGTRLPAIGEVYADRAEKWRAIAARAVEARHAGRLVLVGVASADDAEALAALLEARGLACRRPGAPASDAPDPADAVLILPDRFAAPPCPAGPVSLILAQGFPGGRLDGRLVAAVHRQTADARCACLFSIDDEVIAFGGAGWPGGHLRAASLRRWFYRRAQARAGRRETEVRVGLLQYDRHLDNVLAFAGEG